MFVRLKPGTLATVTMSASVLESKWQVSITMPLPYRMTMVFLLESAIRSLPWMVRQKTAY